MKNLFYLICGFLILGITGCSDETVLDIPGQMGEKTICLSFCEDDVTRSELNSSDVGYDRIEQVYLYIFEKGESSSLSKCVQKTDIGWSKGDIRKEYKVTAQLKHPAVYSFVVVGGDAHTLQTYTLPDENATLETMRVVLAKDKGKVDMRKADLFAGQTEYRVIDESVIHVEMTLRKKVAGIMTYLRNIPYKVGESVVSEVRVRLHQTQNSSLLVWKQNENAEMFGDNPLPAEADDQYLFSWDMTGYGHSDQNIFQIPPKKQNTDGLETLENTLFGGAFLLPVAKNSNKIPTLSIDLWGKIAGAETVELIKSYKVKHNVDGVMTEYFDLKENCLYSMGKKIVSESTEGDLPVDLNGTEVQVQVEPWKGFSYTDDFIPIRGTAHILSDINPDNYIFDAPGTVFQILIKEGNPIEQWELSVNYDQITDKEGRIQYAGNAAFEGTSQTLTPEQLKTHELTDWIHFVDDRKADGTIVKCSNKVVNSEGKTRVITIVLNDYAVKRDLDNQGGQPDKDGILLQNKAHIEQFKSDYRTAFLQLKSRGEVKYFRIRQYNTLTFALANYGKDNPANRFRGAARLDYGWVFNKDTGIAQVCDEVSPEIIWGFTGSSNIAFSGHSQLDSYDGEWNLNEISYKCSGSSDSDIVSGFNGSAVKLSSRDIFSYHTTVGDAGNETIEDDDNRHWYLPAYYEMWGLSGYMLGEGGPECLKLFGMDQKNEYWTSTASAFFMYRVFYTVLNDRENDKYWDRKGKDHEKRVRSIRHF